MIKLINLSSDGNQTHSVEFNGNEITVRFWYSEISACWFFDMTIGNSKINGRKLSIGVLNLYHRGVGVNVAVVDNNATNIDPFKIDDLEKRISVYFLTDAEAKEIR